MQDYLNNDTGAMSAGIVDDRSRGFQAQVEQSRMASPANTFRVTIDLSTAKTEREPYELGSAFKGFYVETDSGDVGAYVYAKLHGSQAHQGFIRVSDGFARDAGEGISNCALHWPAQSGKTIVLIFYTSGEVRFGKQLSVNSGGVSINEGSVIGAATLVPMVANTATLIVAANTSRNTVSIVNTTGASLWVGGPAVSDGNGGTAPGWFLAPGEGCEFYNTAAFYGYSWGAGDVTYTEQTS